MTSGYGSLIMSLMNTIRLTITPKIRQVLDTLKSKYPPLNEPEILKVALSELYVRTTQSAQTLVDVRDLTKRGRKYFSVWLKKQKKNIDTIDEKEAYELIKNA